MRVIIQRVNQASVTVESKVVGSIEKGLLVFLGVAKADTTTQADYLVRKLIELRVFEDSQGKMNLSSQEAGGAFLVVSQFTLYGNCDKGRRPSFDEAAEPVLAEQLYNYFIEQLQKTGAVVQSGKFRATMDVGLINDGPVTFIIDSQ